MVEHGIRKRSAFVRTLAEKFWVECTLFFRCTSLESSMQYEDPIAAIDAQLKYAMRTSKLTWIIRPNTQKIYSFSLNYRYCVTLVFPECSDTLPRKPVRLHNRIYEVSNPHCPDEVKVCTPLWMSSYDMAPCCPS